MCRTSVTCRLMDVTYGTLPHRQRQLNSYGWKEHLFLSFCFFLIPLSHASLLLSSASSAFSTSPGNLPPSYLTPLQSHLLHLIPHPACLSLLLSHHYFGFMSWMSSVSFMRPSTISKVKSNTHKHPRPLSRRVLVGLSRRS